MISPDINMRNVRRVADGFTIRGAKVLSDQRRLCDFCGVVGTCEIKKSVQQLNHKHRIDTDIRTCSHYRPILTFKSEDGLDETFNTFRLRGAWARRVVPGDEVALWNVTSSEIIGMAEVTQVFSGKLDQLLDDHAHFNHLMLTTDHGEAPDALFRIMKGLYGTTWTQRTGDASVIYMRRRHDVEAVQDRAGDHPA